MVFICDMTLSSSVLLGTDILMFMSYVPARSFSDTLNERIDALNALTMSIILFMAEGSCAVTTLRVVWKLFVVGLSLHFVVKVPDVPGVDYQYVVGGLYFGNILDGPAGGFLWLLLLRSGFGLLLGNEILYLSYVQDFISDGGIEGIQRLV